MVVYSVARILTLAGEILWVCAYGVAYYVGSVAQVPAFPVPAIWLNLTWEFLFGVWNPPRNRVTAFFYRSWFLLDALLFAQLYWLPTPVEMVTSSRVTYLGTVSLGAICVLLVQRFVANKLRDSHLQAYFINFFVSLMFVGLYFARTDGSGLSLSVAWFKFLGTSAISIANAMALYRTRRRAVLATVIIVLIAALDLLYLGLLWRRV